MPQIKQLPSGNYNTLVYDFTDSNGKRHYKSITAPSKKEVKLLVAEFLADRESKKQDKDNMTLGEAMDSYINSKWNVLSESTIPGYISIRNNRLKSIINIKISELDADTIQTAINEEAKDHSAKTVRNIHALLRSTLETYRPSFKYKITLPQKDAEEIVVPTEDEMKAIFKYFKGTTFEVPIYLAACCGMRRSEIAALKWSDIDFKNGRITIRAAMVRNVERKLVKKKTKNTSSTRTIRAFEPVLKILREQPQTTENVLQMPINSITTLFPRKLKKIGLQHYRFHDLRHYAVSTMLLLNLPKKYIADYVGHKDERMINLVYGHVFRDKKDTLMDIVNTHFCGFFAQMQNEMQDK